MSCRGCRGFRDHWAITHKYLSSAATRSLYCTDAAACAAQVTGGRNGYGAKLANIFSTEFTIETCDGKSLYKQVSLSNLQSHTVMT